MRWVHCGAAWSRLPGRVTARVGDADDPRLEVNVRYPGRSLPLLGDYDGRIAIDPLLADEFELASWIRRGKLGVPMGRADAHLTFRVR